MQSVITNNPDTLLHRVWPVTFYMRMTRCNPPGDMIAGPCCALGWESQKEFSLVGGMPCRPQERSTPTLKHICANLVQNHTYCPLTHFLLSTAGTSVVILSVMHMWVSCSLESSNIWEGYIRGGLALETAERTSYPSWQPQLLHGKLTSGARKSAWKGPSAPLPKLVSTTAV
jgi:hypothetical protein